MRIRYGEYKNTPVGKEYAMEIRGFIVGCGLTYSILSF